MGCIGAVGYRILKVISMVVVEISDGRKRPVLVLGVTDVGEREGLVLERGRHHRRFRTPVFTRPA